METPEYSTGDSSRAREQRLRSQMAADTSSRTNDIYKTQYFRKNFQTIEYWLRYKIIPQEPSAQDTPLEGFKGLGVCSTCEGISLPESPYSTSVSFNDTASPSSGDSQESEVGNNNKILEVRDPNAILPEIFPPNVPGLQVKSFRGLGSADSCDDSSGCGSSNPSGTSSSSSSTNHITSGGGGAEVVAILNATSCGAPVASAAAFAVAAASSPVADDYDSAAYVEIAAPPPPTSVSAP